MKKKFALGKSFTHRVKDQVKISKFLKFYFDTKPIQKKFQIEKSSMEKVIKLQITNQVVHCIYFLFNEKTDFIIINFLFPKTIY